MAYSTNTDVMENFSDVAFGVFHVFENMSYSCPQTFCFAFIYVSKKYVIGCCGSSWCQAPKEHFDSNFSDYHCHRGIRLGES